MFVVCTFSMKTTKFASLGVQLVMGSIENFLSRLLKDKIPEYHGILP